MDTTVAFAERARASAGREVRVVARPFTVDTAPPPGRELYRFATVNDVHIGEDGFGAFRRMREPDDVEPYPARCLRAAVAEAEAWGAQRIVAKGDLTDDGPEEEFDVVRRRSSSRAACRRHHPRQPRHPCPTASTAPAFMRARGLRRRDTVRGRRRARACAS